MTQRKQEMEQIRQLKVQTRKTESKLNYKQSQRRRKYNSTEKENRQPPKCCTHGKGIFIIGTHDIRHCGTKSLPKNK